MNIGKIAEISGPVVDVEFEHGCRERYRTLYYAGGK